MTLGTVTMPTMLLETWTVAAGGGGGGGVASEQRPAQLPRDPGLTALSGHAAAGQVQD